jgi:alkyl hydroperoxide reductase subunit AhpF
MTRMGILNDRDRQAVRTELEKLGGPVKLVVFSQSLVAGDLCRENEQLVREVAELSDQVSVEILNPAIDRDRAAAYGVEDVPAIVVEGARDYGIRFLGVPSGYEFSNLIDSMITASTGEAQLSDTTRSSLSGLASDIDIKVFSTPT